MAGSFGHRIRPTAAPDRFLVSWCVKRGPIGVMARTVTERRQMGEVSAARFAKRWGLEWPLPAVDPKAGVLP